MLKKKILKNKTFIVSCIILLPFLCIVIAGSLMAPYDPLEMNKDLVLQPYAAHYLLGTDEFGRDILSRILCGLQPTVFIALSATVLACLIGLIGGSIAAYFGKFTNQLLMRTSDIIQCFPPAILALMIIAFWGSNIWNLIIIITIVNIPNFMRIVFASTLQVKNLEFVESEICMGASTARIFRKCIIPNVLSPVIVQFSLVFSSSILLESGLSFMGQGITPPTPDIGNMIGTAKTYLSTDPMYLVWPSIIIIILLLAINLLGDSLRDILDPKQK